MKKYILIALFITPSLLSAQAIDIKEAEAEVAFNFVDDDVDGVLEGFIFTGHLDLNDLAHSKVSGSVETKTIDTNNWFRSRHLRAKKFFNAKDFPQLTFSSTSISGNKEMFQVTGTLQIKGTRKTVKWAFENDGKTLKGTTTINTTDFQIEIHDDRQRNKAVITIVLPYQ
ncbi:MAG: YceI family protein [Bacteroidota bacterium]